VTRMGYIERKPPLGTTRRSVFPAPVLPAVVSHSS
jgi:hypothetical protein